MNKNRKVKYIQEENICYRLWGKTVLVSTICVLMLLASLVIVVDPFFHYHKPLNGLQYPMEDDRYINDGILRHFDYDAFITGSSMTQNFKTSELNALWNVNSVKVSFAGASYKEINDTISRSLSYNPNVKLIVRGLDRNRIEDEKDQMRFEEELYPTYLYDNNLCNDVRYIMNKSVLLGDIKQVVNFTMSGYKTISFDEYKNWNDRFEFGKEAVLKDYSRPSQAEEKPPLTAKEIETIKENIRQNVSELPLNYPDVAFYYFFTPYSICYWDSIVRSGQLSRSLQAEKVAIEAILEAPNIHLYSFENCFDIICNLDNYKDIAHYGENINSWMLKQMHAGNFRLTLDNYEAYLNEVYHFYRTYPYDKLFTAKE